MNPIAILTLISDLTVQIQHQADEIRQLREQLATSEVSQEE